MTDEEIYEIINHLTMEDGRIESEANACISNDQAVRLAKALLAERAITSPDVSWGGEKS